MIRDFLKRHLDSFEPSHGGPLVDAGAYLLRKSARREKDGDERKARGREIAGRALLAVGCYTFMRELFGAAEQFGYARGVAYGQIHGNDKVAEAFEHGRHSGWTESAVHWGLSLPAGLQPIVFPENEPPAPSELWPLRLDENRMPLGPYSRDVVQEGQDDKHAEDDLSNAAAADDEVDEEGQERELDSELLAAPALHPRPGGGFCPRESREVKRMHSGPFASLADVDETTSTRP